MATASVSVEESFRQLWRWLTVNGASFPDQTPPLLTATISADVVPQATTATVTSVNSANTTTQLLAANASRKGATFYNDSTAILYLKFGTTASSSSYTVQMAAASYYEIPPGSIYTGRIDGIWASANGAVRVTELS